MTKIEPISPYLEPIRKSVTVGRPRDEAFGLFTTGVAGWWPLDRYSVSHERTRNVVIEPRVGGGVYEERDDGATFPWGRVLTWEPPVRLVLSWHPGREPDVAQEVEIRFTAVDEGTRVDLEHRNWDKLGDDAADVRESYAGGWAEVLDRCFAGACAHGRAESA